MKTGRVATALSTILLFSFTNGYSQWFENSRFGAGFMLGASKLQGDIDNTHAGLTTGLLLSYSPMPRINFSTVGTYGKMTSGLDAIKTDVVGGAFSGSVYVLPHGMLRPYASAGLGYFHYTAKNSEGETFVREDSSKVQDWKTAFQLGIGLEVHAATPWVLTSTVNYNFTPTDELDAISSGKNDGFFQFMVGLVHYFDFGKRAPLAQKGSSEDKQIQNAVDRSQNKESVAATADEEEAYSTGIYFKPGSAELLAKTKKKLDEIYTYLANNPDEKIQLLGPAKNKKHSDLIVRRALAIKNYLTGLGISADRIIVAPQ